MIDFFHKGSQVGFAINGVGGAILLFYILIELSMVVVNGTFLWRRLLIAFNVHRQVKSTIPRWWKIDRISIITIVKKKNNLLSWDYECYVHVSSNYIEGVWTNDHVKTNSWGKILKCDLYDNITSYDVKNRDLIKQYNRDNTLEKLGI